MMSFREAESLSQHMLDEKAIPLRGMTSHIARNTPRTYDVRMKRETRNPPPSEPDPRHREISNAEAAIFAAELGGSPSIDLHGMTKDEAVRVLEDFIDHEALRGTEAVEIIHGRGSGALKSAIQERLARHSLVISFRDAEHPGKAGGSTFAALYSVRKGR